MNGAYPVDCGPTNAARRRLYDYGGGAASAAYIYQQVLIIGESEMG